VLDRALVSPEWENKFPLASLHADIRLGSDHCPLTLDSGEGEVPLKQRFYFEKQWLLFPEFPQLVINNWDSTLQAPPRSYEMTCDQMDLWQSCIRNLRSYLRGWGANLDYDLRAKKNELGELLKILDERADLYGLSGPEWAFRYELEAELTFNLQCEELYWKQRGRR
jgi:hypothetical protein